MFRWYGQVSASERRTFWACFGGWALDALDAQIFSVVLPALVAAFAINAAQAGSLSSVTLVASAVGGWMAGALSDRIGRVRVLQVTILWYSVFTFLCGFATSFPELLALRALQGVGFGGEWAAGAVLMAETIRPEHRGKVLATVQSAWAVGWGASVLLYAGAFSWLPGGQAWRVLFMLGLLPALLVVYVRRSVPEPDVARLSRERGPSSKRGPLAIFGPAAIRITIIGGLLGAGAHGGYYALMVWLPTFLKTERKLSVLGTSAHLAVVIIAFWCGCLVSAHLLDRIGRRRNILLFAICCAATVISYLLLPLTNRELLLLGFPLGFFAAGIPASLSALFSELYPADVRGTGVGFCYNFGRVASAALPWLVGRMSQTMPLGRAIGIDAALAYGLVVICVLLLPETKGQPFERGASKAPIAGAADPRDVAALLRHEPKTI